ncbi:MAG: LLM class flavin-dependent oxidoreductase, partial [Chromatiales bacterium]|nr:LLM class flavin-dependent oxidoreductase [Chromatiales bacterium]
PPMWVGAASEASIRAAASQGLRLFLDQVATFDEIKERLAFYRDAQAKVGIEAHPHDVALTRPLLLSEGPGERRALVQSQVETLGFLAGSTTRKSDNPFHSDHDSRAERVEKSAILGSPDECIERLQKLADMGIHQVLFTRTSPENLRRFAEHVMSAFG